MKKISTLLAAVLFTTATFAQVGIGTTTPNTSAALDVTSISKGVLIPRMTAAQRDAITSPAQGLIIFCTNCASGEGELQVRLTSSWKNLHNGGDVSEGIFQGGTFNGIDYQLVTSVTGKIWLDRNLGASQVATGSADADSYGDLYQWGRGADGHQLVNSIIVTGPIASGSEGANFITSNIGDKDWLSIQDNTLWQEGNGASNPCPTGFRVPTETEWLSEIAAFSPNSSAGAFGSVLKLPAAGYRSNHGTIGNVGSFGLYWASTVIGANARSLQFTSNAALTNTFGRSHGFCVRCIKD